MGVRRGAAVAGLAAGLAGLLGLAGITPAGASTVARTVVFDTMRTTSYKTGSVRATGHVYPAPAAGSVVYLQRYVASTKTWRNIAAGRTSSTGTVTVDTTIGASVLSFRMYVPAQTGYTADTSSVATFQQFVWRGLFKKQKLGWGGTAHPQLNIAPPNEAPRQSEADLIADKGGTVWVDVSTVGCTKVNAWFGNLTDGVVRHSLRTPAGVIGAIDLKQETEAILDRALKGARTMRLQVQDLQSGHGPLVSTDTSLLCNN